MSRRLNFTKRQRIKRDEIGISVVPGQEHLAVDISLDLERVLKGGLPPTLPVFVEAYHEPRNQRRKLGLAGALDKARVVFDDFAPNEPVLFRVKVVDDAKLKGRIAAACDNIKPSDAADGPAESLLAIKIAPLDGEVFRVDLPSSADEDPVLVLNSALENAPPEGLKAYARSELFVSLVFPAVIRQVLTWYHLVDRNDDDDDDEGPRKRWLSFARRLTGTEPPGGDDTLATVAWIDAVVAAFGHSLNALDRFKSKVGT